MTEKKNTVTSSDINAEPAKTKKPSKKEKVDDVVDGEKVLIYFESGAGYITRTGFKFTKEKNRMAEVDSEEARSLLNLVNFRLPSAEEKEFYYNNLEA